MKSTFSRGVIVIAAVMFCARTAYTQQDPQFSQYILNQFVYNPAYAGTDKVLSATAHLRAQWIGIEGYPFSQNLSVHSPVSLLHGGAGIQVLNEQAGVLRLTSASLSYCYIHRTRIGNFSLGVNGGIMQANLDGSKLRAPDGEYESGIDHQDNILPTALANGLAPDFAAGFFFSSSKVNIGFSATHIVPMQIDLNGGGSSIQFDQVRQYYFQASVLASFSKTVAMRPSVLVKSNQNNLQAEGDLVFSFNNVFWVGGGYRGYNKVTTDAVIGLIGINIGENLKVGYSYDYTLSDLNTVSDGSHEIILNYRVNLVKPAKPGKIIYNPRF